ncbi:MAG: M20/M25/M40 family metallo-hydrolase [Chloroflexota bacterium]|nr:M20/M25/M40 family metallo-hydrolase [Chloroflexota bacterium]
MNERDRRVIAEITPEAIVALASDLIHIPSFKTEETPLARWLAAYFTDRGYAVELQEVEPGRLQVMARLKGAGGGKTMMFNGHLDIDPLALGWRHDPWEPAVEGDRLYGAGVMNMKGGDAAMISAAEAIRKAGVSLPGNILIALVVGELQGGIGTVHMLASGIGADAAIVPEPFGADAVVTTHAGVTEMAISTIGYSRHISDRTGAVDAIEQMMKAIPAIKATRFRPNTAAALPALPLLNVGGIIGGRGRDHDLKGPNFTSDFCTVLVDVRFPPGQTAATVEEDIRVSLDALAAGDPTFRYEIEHPLPARYGALTVTMEPTDIPLDAPLVTSILGHYRDVVGRDPRHIGVSLPMSYAGNDTAHLWRAGISCVLFGPSGGWDESPEEPDQYISISEMVTVAKVMALTALDVCSQPVSA